MNKSSTMITIKLFALILAMLTLLGMLASCVKQPDDPESETTTAAVDLPPDDSAETTADIYAGVPTADLNKETVNILNLTCSWALTTMDSDSDSEGDTLTNAVLARNSILENNINVKLEIETVSGVKNVLITDQTSGDHKYDIIFSNCTDVVSMAQENRLTDLTTIDDIDLDKEWWYPTASDSISIGSARYGLFSDIHLMYHEAFYMLAFNMQMIEDYEALENPYKLVRSGDWTIEKITEMCRIVASDAGADGVKNAADSTSIYGITCSTNAGYSMLIGFDTPLLEYDENNVPNANFTGASERFLNGFTKISAPLYDNILCANTLSAGYSELPSGHMVTFSQGRTLFMYEVTGRLKDHRDDPFSYGVVPSPKYDKDQKDYISPVVYNSACMAVPTGTRLMDDVGVILENMAATSHQKVKPAYYEVTLCYKYVRDPEAIEMLNIVYANGRLEPVYVYDFGSLRTTVQNVFKSGSTDISNQISKMGKIIKADIKQTLKKFGLS